MSRIAQLESGTLLSYQEGRRLLQESFPPAVAKVAVGVLYRISGGNKWLSRDIVLRIGQKIHEQRPAGNGRQNEVN